MIRRFLLRFLGLADHEGRLKDIERHFVVARDQEGKPAKTLADVPLEERKNLDQRTAGLSWQQRRAILEWQERKA